MSDPSPASSPQPAGARRLRRVASAARSYGPSLLEGMVAPRRKFVILSPGRSASELLVELLDSQPGVRCDSEILKHPVQAPLLWVKAHAARAGLHRHRAYGFKALLSQLRQVQRLPDTEGFLRELAASGWLIVALTRTNLLRQAISWVRAAEQDRYHRRVAGWDPPVTIDPEHAIAMMVFAEEANRFISSALKGLDHLALTYEDDLADAARQQASVEHIMDALGLPWTPAHSDLARTSPSALADSVANHEQLAALLRRTRFATFLDESDASGAGRHTQS